MPGFSVEKLAFFLLEPHPKMPSMALTRREASDIAEYIAKLGRAPWRDIPSSLMRCREVEGLQGGWDQS
jgi:hypothetical protein